MKIVITSLHNITHSGHLSLLRDAATYGSELIVIVNSDKQIKLRGTCPLFDENFRLQLVKDLWYVTDARIAIDEDTGVSETLRRIVYDYNTVYSIMDSVSGSKTELEFFFAKGGSDRSSLEQLPKKERDALKELNITPIFGVGGFSKTNSTSEVTYNVHKWYLDNFRK